MIAARKKIWLEPLLYRYFRSRWRHSFNGLYLRGSSSLETLQAGAPVLAYGNHTNWWDLLMVFRLTREIPQKRFYGMMEEKQLRPYRFFSWIGAFSVDLSAPGRAAGGLRYALKLLRRPENLVWIFPQGKLCPPTAPFTLQPGLEFLVQHTPGVQVLPWAFRYVFLRDDRPVVLMEVGEPFSSQVATPGYLGRQVEDLCRKLDKSIADQDLSGFKLLEPTRWTINKRWEFLLCVLRGRVQEFSSEN